MVIVHVSAGLGNQMFQYALYHSFVDKGVAAKIELSAYSTPKETRVYEMGTVFGLKPKIATKAELNWMRVVSKILLNLKGQPYKEKHDAFGLYDPAIGKITQGYVNGYWQSEKYFLAIADKIRDLFSFPPISDRQNLEMLNKIRSANSVSIHIRRGDFLNYQNWALSDTYYHKAIDLVNSKLTNPVYFIFTEDVAWAKQNLPVQKFEFIDFNKGSESYRDMQLMSNCKHHIIANSSFSWWGAWLNPNVSKIVISPDRWIPNITGTRDIVPENWEKISE